MKERQERRIQWQATSTGRVIPPTASSPATEWTGLSGKEPENQTLLAETTSSLEEKGRRRLLIADDERDIVNVIPLLLPHYRWSQAANGREALQRMREEHPDLVLLDMLMPDMNGVQVLQAMKADPTLAGIAVIVLSALSQKQEIEAGLQAGATRYVLKPFDIQVLRGVIEDVLAEDIPPEHV